MPTHRLSIYVFLILLLAAQSFADEKDKKKSDIPESDDIELNEMGPSSAITIIEAPDLSKEEPPSESKEDEDDDGISNVLNDRTLSAFDMLSAIPGDVWVQKFLSQVEQDSDYGDDLDDTDIESEEDGEPERDLTSEEKEGW